MSTITTANSPEETTTGDKPHVLAIFAALILAMLMSSIGQMIFSTALPTIVGELGGINHMSWVITAFLLTQTISLPIYGKLGDSYGRKGLFVFAVVVFITGSALGGIATSFTWLIVARAVQGIAAGGLMVLSQAITADVVPARQRGKYMGIMGGAFALSSVLGPVLGGWFTDGPGWRWGLWLNIPLGVVTLIGIAAFLKLPKPTRSSTIDWAGMAAMATATTCLMLVVTWGGRDYAWTHPLIITMCCAMVAATITLIVIERKATDPIIPLSLFSKRNFTITSTVGLFAGIFLFGALAYMPTYLQMVHLLSPTIAGLMLVPMMLSMTLTSIIVGFIVTATGRYKAFTIIGMSITAVALMFLSRLHETTSQWIVAAELALLGVGVGFAFQLLVLIVQNTFPLSMVGTATATNNFIRQIGASLGSALVGGLFVANLKNNFQAELPSALTALGSKAAEYAQLFSSGGKGSGSLTPTIMDRLPQVLQQAIAHSYNDALTPIFLFLAPLAVIAAIMLLWIKEDSLRETLD